MMIFFKGHGLQSVFQIANGEGVFLPLCPLCKTQFGSFSSMKSHLRNKKDVEHTKYRSDEEKTAEGKKMPSEPQGGGEDEPPVKKRHRLDCPAHVRASSFLGSLGFSPAFLDAFLDAVFASSATTAFQLRSCSAPKSTSFLTGSSVSGFRWALVQPHCEFSKNGRCLNMASRRRILGAFSTKVV